MLSPRVEIFTICSKLKLVRFSNQRTNGPVNAHLISWPTKAQKFAKNDALQSQP